ncbi:MAG: hypothetical protein H6811_02175 [Phycisphaeraceae bacterium]|nr:hypothetical protein [Phycisphaeraceae bacterium]
MENPRWERVEGGNRVWFRLGVYLAALGAGFILLGLLQSARQRAHESGQRGGDLAEGTSDSDTPGE